MDSKTTIELANPPPYSQESFTGTAPPPQSQTSPNGAANPNYPSAFIVNPTSSYNIPLTSRSTSLTCPFCKEEVCTRITYETGRMAHLIALGLCLIGCICCFYLPYFIDDCKDVNHECPNCKKFIGIFRR